MCWCNHRCKRNGTSLQLHTHTHEHRLLAVISNVIVETAKYNVILLVLSGYQPCHYSSSCCGDKLLRYGGKYGLGNVVI